MLSPLSAEVDSCKYLYLREVSEPRDNRLRLLVEEATDAGPSQSIQLPGLDITGCPIESTLSCRLFELVWDFYVAYSVRNESFVARNETETYSGRLLNVYQKSHFLAYVSAATFASNDHAGPLHHIGVNCLNHIIDVVSTKTPTISRSRP